MTAPAGVLVAPAFLWVPPFDRTLGPEVADLCSLAGFDPDPEQRLLLDAVFAVHADGSPVVTAATVVAPRQNIKTGLMKQCTLGWLFIAEVSYIVWSAHEFATTIEALNDLELLLDSSRALRRRLRRVVRASGQEAIELATGQRVRFRARTKSGGRGLSGDRLILDEAFALQPEHMASLVPVLSARPNRQTLYGSSAGLASSVVLRDRRDQGRAGGDPRSVYVEWCDDLAGDCESPVCSHARAEQGCRLDDRRRWARANSQLGRRITAETIEDERRDMPAHEFGRERLGWWDEPDGPGVGLDLDKWSGLADTSDIPGLVAYGVATAPDRSWSAISAAWTRPDGNAQLSLIDYRPATTWVAARMAELQARARGTVTVDVPSRGLVDDAVEPSETVQAEAHNLLSDRLEAGRLRHGGEPPMTVAVRAAKWRPLGTTRVLDRKGTTDIAPLISAALALHGLESAPAHHFFAF